MTQTKKRLFSIVLIAACVLSLMPATAAFANNHRDSPYSYKLEAGGERCTNDHREKQDDSSVYVKPETIGYYVTPKAYYGGFAVAAGGDRTYLSKANKDYLISNYINEQGYKHACLWFDSKKAVTAKGVWSPDSV